MKKLKNHLTKINSKILAKSRQFKLFIENDKILTDCFLQNQIVELVKNIDSPKSESFINWFLYNDNSIDGQSRIKAYSFWESNLIKSKEIGTIKSLQKIHAYIFSGLYVFAGEIRAVTISKNGFMFTPAKFLHNALSLVESMPQSTFNEIVDKYVEMNIAHPFVEGNGRSTRIWLDLIFKNSLKKCVDWSKINKKDYLKATRESPADSTKIKLLLKNALTDKIDSREIFIKGIDYSYYYEQVD